MKPQQFIPAVILVVGGGLGIYALLRSHQSAASNEEEAAPPTVVSVQVGALKRTTLHRYVTGYGTVAPAPATTGEPAADAPLAAPTAGVVASVEVVEGQHVARGELLLTLNSGSTTFDYARREVERQKLLYSQHNTSLKSLQDAETQLALLRVTSPLAGTVTRVNVKPGAAVDLATVVAEVVDLRRLVVNADIPQAEAAALKTSEMEQILTQPPVTAAVSYVSPTVDPGDGTVLVRAALPPDSGLRPGQFVPLRIVTGVETDCLAAPEASVVTDVEGRSVIALVKGDQAVLTPVQTGVREGGWMQIRAEGLKAGDAVVTVGAYGLPDKTKIKVVTPAEADASAAGPDPTTAQ